jgi:RNA polymerase sporulation-specific sigma factor
MFSGGEHMTDANQQQDMELLRRIKNNDEAAREELVAKYTPMVKCLVRNSYGKLLDHEDLTQEGLIGLLGAIDEYDGETHNIKFSSFAYLCIIRKIYNCIRQSRNSKNRTLNEAISLHTYVDRDETRTIMDLISAKTDDPEEWVQEAWVDETIEKLLRNHLSILEYEVVTRIINGYAASEIEKEIGVSAKSIDNARTRAKFKLGRLVARYGSLLSPKVPQKVRKRKDLYLRLRT